MDCKVILNINGIETTSSIKLEDGFDKNDAIIQIKKNLSQLVADQSIDTTNLSHFYNAAVSIYRDIKRKFGVASYKDIKVVEYEKALEFISKWIEDKEVI